VSVVFTAPTSGETVSVGSVMVIVNYTGPQLVAAANATKLDDYHIHYFLDPTPYIGTTVPVAGLPRVMAALQEAGFDDAALRKLSHENWLRVLGAT
jgi:microsomal dipeptidase-like Zn-dependent dipeptidase